MYSQLNSSFSTFMGFPDPSPVFLSQKDTQLAMEKECNFLLIRPSLEFQDACRIAPSKEEIRLLSQHDQGDEQSEAQQGQEREQDRSHGQILLQVSSSSLKVKLPSERDQVMKLAVGQEEGCKTPTSKDQKIPQLVCPPPPKKPKTLPITNKKGSRRRRVLLDLSDEIESLFPPALLADFGNKIKKVRKESFII